ncbi:DUF4102 domain-containing protein [Samsonia erythrinae]|uniref:Uncharacterized protein n=1 Tax=Samsonia erythrinae TaxID=160434 RepID=A0A4R3VIR5_9GAMM|nr:DUF4102 domain-containing protein [Samsonia erythrinae]TCV03704.1 hypothetical protein EDC54_11333 [Samsonia erythrinae]
MALTDAVTRQARTTGKAYTLNDTDGLSLFVTANGATNCARRWPGASIRAATARSPTPRHRKPLMRYSASSATSRR